MPISVTMPALSPTMEEGTLAQWRVKEGDKVAPGDVLAEIETDKATMEVEAIDEGTVGKLLVAEGTEGVPVNKVIALLLEEGESAADIDEGTAEALAPAPVEEHEPTPQQRSNGEILANPSAKVEAQERGIDLHSVKGTGPHGRITKGDVLAAAAEGKTARAEPVEVRADGGDRIFASPLARRMAEDKGYALADIEGSGPGGRIVKADVEAFTPSAKPGPEKVTEVPESEAPYEEVRLTTMRKTIARRMVEAKQTVPHFYLTVDMEIDALLAARKEINETAGEGIKVSVNDLIIRAAGLALMQVPDANVQFAGDKLRRFKRADIAVAVALDGGLITPIIRGANEKGLGAISTEMKELAARAREGKLLPEEYQGGTISISNLGMFGVREFAAVINPPHAAILAIGAGEKRAVVRGNDELAVATVMTVNMACDHRAIDGAIGATYLQALKGLIEHPVRMLL